MANATAAASTEILMLEAPPQGPSWPGPLTNAEIIDALPYIDEDYYSSAAVKNEVDLMVEEELRRSAKKPADFLKDLPPLAKPDFKNNPVLAREYDRVRASKPPVVLDFSRDKAEMPRRSDEASWRLALQKAQCYSQHNVVRLENLELMDKYGPDAWIRYNNVLQSLQSRLQKLAHESSQMIGTVNRERKEHQQNTAYELNALSAQWRELSLKNIEIQAACAKIENYIDELKKEAAERGWDLKPMENGQLNSE
ncbi:pre-mRNA-splicing factor SPF27 homolog [Argentina anserina]|uniref:pre-mRNA-splicing factor SPF27 homolog n=1 Tax=Argentina anserina TaxID=57926 RepID=UPI0021767501|nr:pre-mRNA-splicing factor SPF27 homolog [Potentilla anserina]XP_050378655.1 pre-mRNA-splicing factor SPF27 homolog [Potentilla anserina]XP_050378656.1 pre-mRNA-splicing factor SPF27 homolog [Potentilla anserina]XP_050378657.1 pre-mRNA-splicing factor SPF27 homolog [Potentilla anserina]